MRGLVLRGALESRMPATIRVLEEEELSCGLLLVDDCCDPDPDGGGTSRVDAEVDAAVAAAVLWYR